MWRGIYITTAVTIISALCIRWVASRRPALADAQGWSVIRPGPAVYGLSVAATAFSLLLFYVWLFVGSSLPDANEQMLACLLTAIGFMAIAFWLLMSGSWRTVRWKDRRLEIVPFIGRPRIYKFEEIQSITCRPRPAEFVLHFGDRQVVKLSVLMNGTRELLEDLGNPVVDYES